MLKKDDELLVRFSDSFERLIVKMQEVDSFCVDMTKDISKQDLSLIGFVGKRDRLIMRDIAEFLEVPFSTATGIVDKLVQKGYLLRFNSEEDRRTVWVGLTEKLGKETYEFFSMKKMEMSQRIMSLLTSKEQEQFLDIMEKVTSGISSDSLQED
ncbi:MAG: MarR family transcriptional regulator [Bacteroidota bacterium]